MRRETITPRPGWQSKVEALGFDFYTLDGKAYWTEQACYAFTAGQIDELEAATEQLHALCLQAVEHVVANRLWEWMKIPPSWGDYITEVWRRSDPTISGRFDLVYDGRNPPKMLEYNADTPTSLYEAAVVQWYWLKDVKPAADQFNSIHEKLIDAWKEVGSRLSPQSVVHFARFENHPEDLATSEYLRDTAIQAGLKTKTLTVAEIGWNGQRFTDPDEVPIQVLSKLYPWEWMMREAFGAFVPKDGTAFIEPVWKLILSNKMILPLLWEGFPGHPHLLPSFDSEHPDLGRAFVKKPVFGREGHNVTVVGPGVFDTAPGAYGAEGYVWQAYEPLPVFDGNHALVGSWVIGGKSAGIGMREDERRITHNTSRFVPHYFE
ncbi:glutathionylspermidine synthase family protein [Reyranella aquatilis]|uniref:Glutathionylspermidine synthase family protein n=1 Tax=Reyranella aquatilis TaxID=2035356 RepID=A0ABS8KN95_9HYPH|nr:glutathionylspermidine synthase family protein [Reyranella aquatilis]MCC8427532.1 glutathionylspermidine synthase family protein [Reyranella aquatilis]